MFTKVLPAGNLIDYIKGPKDSHGVKREEPPQRIRGNDELLNDLLTAQAPFGVGRKKKLRTLGKPGRAAMEWVRHCRMQLVHIINCFHETEEIVTTALLKRTACATEDLVLAGMPREALHFTWFKHGKKKGGHAHAAMARFLLPSGRRYVLRLDRELRVSFDRLISRRLGLTDPLDPAGFRVVYGGRNSWKPHNYELIRAVCREATRRWHRNELTEPGQFARMLPDFGLAVIFIPDSTGHPLLQPGAAGSGAAPYPHAVVARRKDTGHTVVFSGPACRGDFAAEEWRRRLEARQREAKNLEVYPYKTFEVFKRCFARRHAFQHQSFSHLRDEECIRLADFDWLNPASTKWEGPDVMNRLTDADVFGPDMYWGDRLYPFVSDTDPDVQDIADPSHSPLRDWIEEDDQAMAANEDVDESAAHEIEAGPALVQPNATQERKPRGASADAHPPSPPLPNYYHAEKRELRRRVQFDISLSFSRATEADLLELRKRQKELERAKENRGDRNGRKPEGPPPNPPPKGDQRMKIE